jgi:hypothetical protein
MSLASYNYYFIVLIQFFFNIVLTIKLALPPQYYHIAGSEDCPIYLVKAIEQIIKPNPSNSVKKRE